MSSASQKNSTRNVTECDVAAAAIQCVLHCKDNHYCEFDCSATPFNTIEYSHLLNYGYTISLYFCGGAENKHCQNFLIYSTCTVPGNVPCMLHTNIVRRVLAGIAIHKILCKCCHTAKPLHGFQEERGTLRL